jgi:MbtH protein
MSIFDEDKAVFDVVINHEEQYSIWPQGREIPLGWKAVGQTGTKSECLDHIKTVWTDMRPLSLRKQMDQRERDGSHSAARKMSSGI